MTRLAAVLAAALRDADPGSWGGTRQQYAEYPLTAERLVAAIPEPEREALEVGLLLEAIVEATPEGWHTVELKPNEPDFDIGDGTGWVASIAAPEWWEGGSDDRDEHLRIGHGPSIHAALTALLDRLVAS